MHIEPGLVTGAKLALSAATAAGVTVYTLKAAWTDLVARGVVSLAVRSVIASALVLFFFQVAPHHPAGVSEVHLIMGSTLFLLLGTAPAAIGLALGLLAQGVLFAQIDLPQYGMNITTLLVPLFALKVVADRVISPNTAYVDVTYKQTLMLSATYQGGIVLWVAFWATYGSGFGAANLASVGIFGAAYMSVLLIEPLVDLAVLAGAKSIRDLRGSILVTPRLFKAA